MTDSQPPGVGGRTAEDWNRLNEEWRLLLAAVKTDPTNDRRARHARRWLLVNIFGTEEKFHFDPEFHAQVWAAEQMLDLLSSDEQNGAVDA